MRRLVTLMVLLAALSATSATAASSTPGTTTAFVVAGGGWGHGVGMSQWGAFGQAKAGRDYHQILGTYYRGTEIGSAPAPLLERVRVLVADGLPEVTLTNVLAVFDGAGKRYPLPAGTVTVGSDLKLPVGKDGKPVVAGRAADLSRGQGRVPRVPGQGLPRRPAGRSGRRPVAARQRRRPRGLSARGRPG